VDYVLQTERSDRVSHVIRPEGVNLSIPALCDIEFTSAMRRSLRIGEIDSHRAEEAVNDYLDLPLSRFGHTKLLEGVLAMRENFSAYDATYVVLAQQLGAQLLTTDRRLAAAITAHPRLGVALAG
jgi:predicted nucleic acid-binding protein